MSSSQPKIFGIGLSKTGTTSLAHALELLGYRTKDYLGITRYSPGDLSSMDLDAVDANDAFTDTPIPSFYRELDEKYPGSKFILTVREMDGWLKSCKKQFTRKLAEKQNDASINLFMDIYDCFVFDETKFTAGYERFVNDVLHYFRDRPDDLLILDLSGGDGWEKLCRFLGTAAPDVPFQRANVTRIRWINIDDVVAIARLAGADARQQHDKPGSTTDKSRRQGTWLSYLGKFLMGKTRQPVHGCRPGIRKAMAKKSRKIILKKLGELNTGIPIVAGGVYDAASPERASWNHFWLVDVPDAGAGRHRDLCADFVISIALIEDSRPIMGVVYAPAIDRVYYATAGKEALMIEGNNSPVEISRHGKNNAGDSPGTVTGLPPSENNQEKNNASLNKALAMCMVAEGKLETGQLLKDTLEWQTAGAHAILNSSGKKVINAGTGEELIYNKERFENGPVCIT